MTKNRIFRLTTAALWTALTTPCLAIPSPQQFAEAVAQAASAPTATADQSESLPKLQEAAWLPISGPFENPFAPSALSAANEDRDATGSESEAAGAPAAYPTAAPQSTASSSSWRPTHFEFFGDVQWRNLSNNAGFSSSYCLPSGCVTNTASFNIGLGLDKWGVGPDFGFQWTPEKKILRAKSKIWVEYGQLDRSKTHNLVASIDFLGFSYAIDTTLQTQLNQKVFTLGYSPHWGNDKFGIGPEFIYQHMGLDFILSNLTPGAPPPIKESLNVPNNLALMGVDFDFTPIQQLDIYGRSGWIPCCGGGYHGNETEFGAKYYIRRNFSILGGFKYVWLKRDFNAPANTYTVGDQSVTLGPFSGFIKFPGIGPFVGASYRF